MVAPRRTPALEALGKSEKHMAATDGDVGRAEALELLGRAAEIQTLEEIADEQMGAILGCSRSRWNKIKLRRYSGSVQPVLRRLRRWLDERASQAPMATGEYVATHIGRMIQTVCRRATRRQTIGLVVTPAGCGKTLALADYAGRLADKAVLLAGGEICCAKEALAREIADRLGVHVPARGATAVVYREIRRRLAGLYAGGKAAPVTILLDEATSIRPNAVNMLRNLHDDPACRCPLVLADTWRLDSQLHSARGLPGGYEQLRSRAGAQYRLAVDAEIAREDVEAVAASVLSAIGWRRRLPSSSLTYLHRFVANRPDATDRNRVHMRDGALRNVMQRLHAAADVAEAAGRPPAFSVAELDAVAELVGHRMQHPGTPDPFAAPAPAPEPEPTRRAAS